MGITSRSRTAFPLAEVSLEREAASLVSSQSTSPSARVFNDDGFSGIIDDPVRDMLRRAVFVAENDVFLGDMCVHSRVDGSRVRNSQVADEQIVSWREGPTSQCFSKRSLAAKEMRTLTS